MKKLAAAAVLMLGLLGPLQAQEGAIGLAGQLSSLTATADVPRNVPLRFAVLADMLGQPDLDRETIQPILSFFSTTRQLFWATEPGGQAAQAMGQLEQAMVPLAARYGVSLDLPPVGAARAAAVSYTPEALLSSARQAERLAAQALTGLSPGAPGAPELQALHQALAGVRVALEEGADPAARMKSLEIARARFLLRGRPLALSGPVGQAVETLIDQMDILVAAHRQLEPAAVTR